MRLPPLQAADLNWTKWCTVLSHIYSYPCEKDIERANQNKYWYRCLHFTQVNFINWIYEIWNRTWVKVNKHSCLLQIWDSVTHNIDNYMKNVYFHPIQHNAYVAVNHKGIHSQLIFNLKWITCMSFHFLPCPLLLESFHIIDSPFYLSKKKFSYSS